MKKVKKNILKRHMMFTVLSEPPTVLTRLSSKTHLTAEQEVLSKDGCANGHDRSPSEIPDCQIHLPVGQSVFEGCG